MIYYGSKPSDPIDLTNPVNRNHPLNRGLVSWWDVLPGRRAGPKWYDLMGQNHGTLTNMTSATASGWQARTNQGGYGSMLFDGVDDYVAGQSITGFANTSPHTYSGLLYLASLPNTTKSLVTAVTGTSGTAATISGLNKLQFFYQGGNFGVSSSSAFSTGWNYWVISYDGAATISFYFNGKLDSTASTGATTWGGGAPSVFIGRWVSAAFFLAGYLNRIRIHNRALSAAEVLTDYQSSLRYDVGLLNRIVVPTFSYPSVGTVGSLLLRRRRRAAA